MLSERLEQGRVLARFSKHLRADKADALALERFQKRPSGPSSSVFNSLEYSSEENTIYPLGAIKVPS